MNCYNIYKKALGAMVIALAFVGCSDEWDEHYNAATTVQEGSLWQAIKSDANLSNFARVIEACGYDTTLVGRQMFTVFAPTNDNFSSSDADALIAAYQQEKAARTKDDDNTAIKEFLQNHIAPYNYSVSSVSNDSIVMLNGKYQVLTANTFGGEPIVSSNKAYGNGVLFTLGNKVDYFPNIFEYLRKDADLDSVANFLYSYNKYVFDATSSVPGDIVNGKTVYLDSVVNLRNDLFSTLGRINSEDSTYRMVVPTNEVWKEKFEEYKQYYQYDASVSKRDSMTTVHAGLALLRGTVFSMNENTEASLRDSAMSVNAVIYPLRKIRYGSYNDKYYQYDKPYQAGGVFDGTENVTTSNGRVMKAAAWNIDKKQTFFQTVRVEAENSERLDSVDRQSTEAPIKVVNVSSSNPFYGQLSNNSIAMIMPKGTSTNTFSVFNVPNLLSNIGYDIYVVTAPALAVDTLASAEERLPTKFRVRLSYNDADGKPIPSNRWQMLKSSVSTTPDGIDVIKVGENVKLPFCSVGTDNAQVKLIFDTRVSNSDVRNGKFNRILRLDQIIFKPHED